MRACASSLVPVLSGAKYGTVVGMDPVAFAYVYRAQWDRLDELASKRRLSGPEADEFLQLYQQAAGHLALIRAQAPDPEVILRLSAVIAKARSRLTAQRITWQRAVIEFFTRVLPLAFYRIRWWSVGVTAACIAVFAIVFFTYAGNEELLDTLGSYSQQEGYAKVAFEGYYSEFSHSEFSTMVWTNNAWIALQAVASGVTGFYPVYVLFSNMASVAQAGAILDRFGELPTFFQLILPHGQLELMAIFVSGAAGLRLFWALVVPGPRPRAQSLAAEGRHTVLVAVGLVFVLFVSGLVEGYVTPSPLPWPVKIAIGTLALAAFWWWTIACGRQAAAELAASERADEGWHVEYAG